MKNRFSLTAIVLMMSIQGMAQVRSNAYTSLLNPFLYNPSLAANAENIRCNFNAISNIQGTEGSARSYNFSAMMPLQKTNGMGLKVITQTVGAFQTVNLEGAYAKRIQLNDKNTLNFGMSLGFNQTNLRMDMMSSMVDRSDIAFNNNNLNKMLLSAGAGASYRYGKQAELSLSFPSLITGNSPMNSLMVANAAYNISLGKNNMWKLRPNLNYYQVPNSPKMTDAILSASWNDNISFGAGYRTNGSMIAHAGINFNNFAFNYAYLQHVSGISDLAPAKNEISLVFGFNKPAANSKLKNQVVSDEVIQDEIDKINERLTGLMNIEKTNPGLVNMKKELSKLNKDLDKVLSKYKITNPQQIEKIKGLRDNIDSVIAKYND